MCDIEGCASSIECGCYILESSEFCVAKMYNKIIMDQ
jgi:hypothetical protein